MSTRWQRSVLAYVVLILVLAAAGILNQAEHAQRSELMDRKTDLSARVSALRVEAAKVRGPLAVARYAETLGMIPVPDAKTVIPVAPAPAPTYVPPLEGLEIRTLWR